MTSAVEVTTDLFEPELPKGPYAVIDPDHAGSFKGATDRGQWTESASQARRGDLTKKSTRSKSRSASTSSRLLHSRRSRPTKPHRSLRSL